MRRFVSSLLAIAIFAVAYGCGGSAEKANTAKASRTINEVASSQPATPLPPAPLLKASQTIDKVSATATDSAKNTKIVNKTPDDLLAALEQGEPFELLSLSPEIFRDKPEGNFHGWKVLGTAEVSDAEARKTLVAALKKGVDESDGSAAGCFNPRHGIRVMQDGKETDFVICFQCHHVLVFAADQPAQGFTVTKSPQADFDRVLTEAHVPLPPKGPGG
jgi:hypothetical protein